ncbi:TRAM domain-containing protein [Haladaptatus sp. CMAA 1911]|uniref:TRAM domain-containing protein n=1 Tax=unclassified Haladaptatus TaxID=2622732 RepID=UPI003754490C
MEIPDQLCCLFSGEIEVEDDSYTLTIPSREITDGDIQPETTYRVAILNQPSSIDSTDQEIASQTTQDEQNSQQQSSHSTPPVEEGEHRTVEIEDIGEQGDGIARVERGYVIIVPDTEKHDHVTIEINSVRPTVAFGEVIEQKEE